jgi:hypothetical protein
MTTRFLKSHKDTDYPTITEYTDTVEDASSDKLPEFCWVTYTHVKSGVDWNQTDRLVECSESKLGLGCITAYKFEQICDALDSGITFSDIVSVYAKVSGCGGRIHQLKSMKVAVKEN